jgi:hypothetical protein
VWVIALFLVAGFVDLLLLSRATRLLARLAFIPFGRTRRIELSEARRMRALTEPGEGGSYRTAPERHIDVTRLSWPSELRSPEGTIAFDEEERVAVLRTRWAGKRLPGLGRIDVRGTADAVELAPRFIPSPVSLLMLVALGGIWLRSHFDPEAAIVCVVIAVLQISLSYVDLKRQLERAVTAFELSFTGEPRDHAPGPRVATDDAVTAARVEEEMAAEREAQGERQPTRSRDTTTLS